MGFNLRRLSVVAAGFTMLTLGLAASATAATPETSSLPQVKNTTLLKTLPTGVTPSMTRPLATAPMQSTKLSSRAHLAKKLGISAQNLATAAGTPSPTSDDPTDFLGYAYYNWGFAAVYDGVFDYSGLTWYHWTYYFYDYSGNYLGYGSHFWYYYFGWNYYGWVCCGY